MSKNALENSKRENLSMTCIICPMGCSMEVSLIEEGGNKTVTEVKDNESNSRSNEKTKSARQSNSQQQQ